MAYVSPNLKSAKALKEAVARGDKVYVYSPGLGGPYRNRTVAVEGPHYPEPHRWYAEVETDENEMVVKVVG